MKLSVNIILYFLLSGALFSQQIRVTRDFGVWGGVNIEKKLSENFEINLEQQLRYYSNVTKFDDYVIDFGGRYKMNKNFKLGADLRYTYNAKRWREAENNYRYNFDLNYKGDISNKFTFLYRLRYQHEYVNLFSDYPSEYIHYSAIRNKIEIQYRLHKMNELYVSAELWRLIETFKDPSFNKIIFYLGDNIKTKTGSFNCSFGYEQEINTNYPLSFFYLKTIYTLKL